MEPVNQCCRRRRIVNIPSPAGDIMPLESAEAPWPSTTARETFWTEARASLWPRLYGFVTKSECSCDEAEEIVMDVIGELALRESEFIACSSRWEFVLPIVRDRCARAQQRWRHEMLAVGDPFEAPDPTLTEERERNSLRRVVWLRNALRLLPPKQREAIQLHMVEGRSYREVATAIQSSEGAVRKNTHVAMERLRGIAAEFPPPADSPG